MKSATTEGSCRLIVYFHSFNMITIRGRIALYLSKISIVLDEVTSVMTILCKVLFYWSLVLCTELSVMYIIF